MASSFIRICTLSCVTAARLIETIQYVCIHDDCCSCFFDCVPALRLARLVLCDYLNFIGCLAEMQFDGRKVD
jgi:hypothetical protein